MERKTTAQIEQEMFDALEDFFVGRISGSLYQSDCRPTDSRLEDAVITVSTASAGQIQEGRARINIFVPDIDAGLGRPVPNKERIDNISRLDGVILETLNNSDTDYVFDLFMATGVENAVDIKQHFVTINIEFKHITF